MTVVSFHAVLLRTQSAIIPMGLGCSLWLPGAVEALFFGLLLISLVGLMGVGLMGPKTDVAAPSLKRVDWMLMAGLAAFPLSQPLAGPFQEGAFYWQGFDRPSRLLLTIPILLWLSRTGVSLRSLQLSLVVALVGGLGLGGWEVWVVGDGQAAATMVSPVALGSIAVLFVAVLFVAVSACGGRGPDSPEARGRGEAPGQRALRAQPDSPEARGRGEAPGQSGQSPGPDRTFGAGQRALRALPAPLSAGLTAVGILAGLGLTALSGTRGAWLALLVLAPVWAFTLRTPGRQPPRRHLLLLIGAAAVLLSAVVASEWNRTQTELEASPTNPGSAQVRLILWSEGLRTFAEAPLAGVGPVELQRRIHLLDDQMKAPYTEVSHLHQEIIQAMAAYGLIGLSGLLAFWGGLAAFFAVHWRQSTLSSDRRTWAQIGLVTLVVMVVTSMTDAQFSLMHRGLVYCLMIALAAGGCRAAAPSDQGHDQAA